MCKNRCGGLHNADPPLLIGNVYKQRISHSGKLYKGRSLRLYENMKKCMKKAYRLSTIFIIRHKCDQKKSIMK